MFLLFYQQKVCQRREQTVFSIFNLGISCKFVNSELAIETFKFVLCINYEIVNCF